MSKESLIMRDKKIFKAEDLDFALNLSKEVKNVDSDIAIFTVPVTKLTPGKFQPRIKFDNTSLQELSHSIKEQGVLQPLIVRRQGNGYEIIAGERRWRAAQIAALDSVPVIVRDIDDATALAIGLIENIQRQDLNPIEEAEALQRLLVEFSITHEEVAKKVGRSRAAVSNLLRLLALGEEVKQHLHKGQLAMGHARALLSLAPEQQSVVAKDVIKKQLSVRQTEKLISGLQKRDVVSKNRAPIAKYDDLIYELEDFIFQKTQLPVGIKISQANDKLNLTIQFNNLVELKQGLADFMKITLK